MYKKLTQLYYAWLHFKGQQAYQLIL